MKRSLRFRLFWSSASLALATVYGILAISYINAVFLTIYPAYYLAYFYLGLAVLFIIANQLMGSYIAHHYRKGMLFLQGLCITLILVYWQLGHFMPLKLGGPFIFCVFLMSSNKFLTLNYWNGVSHLLDIREFKYNSNLISSMMAAAAVLLGLIIPYFIQHNGLDRLLPLMAIVLFFNMLVLQPVDLEDPRATAPGPAHGFHYQYKLQKLFLPFVLGVLIFSTLVDYTFKYQVAKSLEPDQIAIYTSRLFAASNLIVFIFQLLCVKRIFKKFGIFGFIVLAPIVLILVCMGVILWPNLWTVSFLLLGYSVVNFSIFDLSFQLLANVLPPALRSLTRLHLRGLTLFWGSLLSALLILFLADRATPVMICSIILIFSAAFIFLSQKITQAYNEALEDNLKQNHIVDLDEFYLTRNTQEWYEHINACLTSQDDVVRLLGYEILAEKKQLTPTFLLDKVCDDLYAANQSIRVEAVKILREHMNQNYFQCLKKRLEIEKDGEVIWWIFQAFNRWQAEEVLPLAKVYFNSDDELSQASSINSLIRFGSLADAVLALNRLMALIESDNPKFRISAARVLSLFDLHGSVESLSGLIVDKEVEVSIVAIQAAMEHPHVEHIDALIHQMSVRNAHYYAATALLNFGQTVVPILLERINHIKHPIFHRAAIRTIAKIEGEKADQALVKLMSQDQSEIRNEAVKSIAYRSMQTTLSRDFLNEVSHRIKAEKDHLTYYRQLLQIKLTDFERQEIETLSYGTIYRLLYLFSVDNAEKMLPIISLILEAMTQAPLSELLQQEIELFDNYLQHSEYRQALFEIFDFKSSQPDLSEDLLAREKLGPWLSTVFSIKFLKPQGIGMHDLEKLVVLRGCTMFKNLSADILLVLASRLEVEIVAQDTVLFRENDLPGDLYIIAEGEINITHLGRVVNQKKKFDFFGELSLLDDKPRTATAITLTEVKLLKMSKMAYDRLLDDFPDILRNIARSLLGYLRNVQPITKED